MKLYVVTRSDLPPGAQCAQSCHAMRLFAEEHPHIDRYWYAKSNNLVVLAAEDEASLYAVAVAAKNAGIAVSLFREPDLDNALTAIAIEPDGAKLTSNLPLAMKTKRG